MYIPSTFRVDDAFKLAAFIKRQSFATLITHDGTAPFASHVPMLWRQEVGGHGTLLSHLARANPQWQHFASGQEALVIFHGPQSYISSSWYKTEQAVPTWNYTVVHAYGIPKVVSEPSRLECRSFSSTETHPNGTVAKKRWEPQPALATTTAKTTRQTTATA